MARAVKAQVTATGPLLVDRTPAVIPADLAALAGAVDPSLQPVDRQWQAAYGSAPNYQLARVVGGVWVGADTASLDSGAPDWAAATPYVANQLAVQGGTLYRRNTAGTSGAAFDATEQAEWTAIGAPPAAMTGATNAAAGTGGTVPAPIAGQQDLTLHADGLWRQKTPNWTANTFYSQGANVYQDGAIRRRIAAGQSGLVFNAAEEADWLTLADATASGRTLHNFAGPVALTRVDAAYQGELHIEAPNSWTLDGSMFEDGDWFFAVNTAGLAVPSTLTPSNFAGAFVRDGSSTPIVGGVDLGSSIDARWVITVTENGGNKFLNVYPFGSAPEPDLYVPTTDTQTLEMGGRYLIGLTHTVDLPPITAAINGQFITMAAPSAWGDLTGAINHPGATLEPPSGLPTDQRDIVTFIADFAGSQWLVRTGGDPALQELDLSFDTVADLPDPALYTAGTQASVTDDGALTGVYVASGINPGPGTGWVKA